MRCVRGVCYILIDMLVKKKKNGIEAAITTAAAAFMWG